MKCICISNSQKFKCFLLFPLLIPHVLLFFYKRNDLIHADLERYNMLCNINLKNELICFIYFISCHKTYRNVFYYRIGKWHYLLSYLKAVENCVISTSEIGGGLFIQHGAATYIAAKRIGKNCYINQCVTLGYSNKVDHPILLDNVSVKAGAKVIGKVTVGNNVIVGANAVVVKSVPDNCTVVGVPAYIIRRDGIKAKQYL